jgi:S1-C subfamily serine protease
MMGVVLKQEGEQVVIDELSPHGMAGKMGLKKGDVFLSLDGRPIKTVEDIKLTMFFKKHGGDKVAVRVKRPHWLWADQEIAVEVPL